jgi:hypothetical protein
MPWLSRPLNGNNMRVIKLGLISVFVLMVIATAIGLLLPATVLVSRAVNIKSRKAPVYELVTDLRNWTSWVEGMKDSSVKVESATVAQMGKTRLVVTDKTDSTLQMTWQLANGVVQQSTIRLITDASEQITVVQWQFVQQLNWYPWERFGSMMNDKIIGTLMEKNLLNLQQKIEQSNNN